MDLVVGMVIFNVLILCLSYFLKGVRGGTVLRRIS